MFTEESFLYPGIEEKFSVVGQNQCCFPHGQ
jgi:hypothetical protein